MLHIVYHPKYLQYNFGSGHPFWPERAKRFLELLTTSDFEFKLHQPKRANDEQITLVHSTSYLEHVKHLAMIHGNLSVDTPLNPQVLEAAYYSVGGSILAAELALLGKRVINLLGGLHHAGVDDSSGFCIFNDHAIAVKSLQKDHKIKTAFIFDVDVHAGQGTQEIFYQDPTVYTLSIHQDPHTLYPGTGFPEQIGEGEGRGFNQNIILPPGTQEKEFLQAAEVGLSSHAKFNPDLTFLVFGADTYKEDPLANIKLELGTYRKLGAKIKKIKKLCILCAGGYSGKVPEIWLNFLDGLLK